MRSARRSIGRRSSPRRRSRSARCTAEWATTSSCGGVRALPARLLDAGFRFAADDRRGAGANSGAEATSPVRRRPPPGEPVVGDERSGREDDEGDADQRPRRVRRLVLDASDERLDRGRGRRARPFCVADELCPGDPHYLVAPGSQRGHDEDDPSPAQLGLARHLLRDRGRAACQLGLGLGRHERDLRVRADHRREVASLDVAHRRPRLVGNGHAAAEGLDGAADRGRGGCAIRLRGDKRAPRTQGPEAAGRPGGRPRSDDQGDQPRQSFPTPGVRIDALDPALDGRRMVPAPAR